jgi:DNA repair protein RadC
MGALRTLHIADRPRERLVRLGAETLTDIELLATVLGTGMVGRDVLAVARDLLNVLRKGPAAPTLEALLQIRGIGRAKAITLLASYEFFRRRLQSRGTVIENPAEIIPYLRARTSNKQEHFLCASLNGAQELLEIRTVTVGLLDRVEIHPREVFADPLTDRAAAVLLAHNHPAQRLDPSEADLNVTSQLIAAGRLLGIQVIDHIIFNDTGYFSMREKRCAGFE